MPDQVSRLIGLDLDSAPSNWPALHAFLDRATAWFRYRRASTTTTTIASPPTLPLTLSPYAGAYLAVNLTAALVEFRKELTAAENETAFSPGAVCDRSPNLHARSRPLDPLTPIIDFPSLADVETELQLLNARNRAIP